MSGAASAPPVPSKGATLACRQRSHSSRAAAPAPVARFSAESRPLLPSLGTSKNQSSRSWEQGAYSGTTAFGAWGPGGGNLRSRAREPKREAQGRDEGMHSAWLGVRRRGPERGWPGARWAEVRGDRPVYRLNPPHCLPGASHLPGSAWRARSPWAGGSRPASFRLLPLLPPPPGSVSLFVRPPPPPSPSSWLLQPWLPGSTAATRPQVSPRRPTPTPPSPRSLFFLLSHLTLPPPPPPTGLRRRFTW